MERQKVAYLNGFRIRLCLFNHTIILVDKLNVLLFKTYIYMLKEVCSQLFYEINYII